MRHRDTMPYAKHHCEQCGADEADAEFVRYDGLLQAVVYTCLLCTNTEVAA